MPRPTLGAVAASDSQIDLTWADNATDESAYRIERSPDGVTWAEIVDAPRQFDLLQRHRPDLRHELHLPRPRLSGFR